jgi:hypothetical protein
VDIIGDPDFLDSSEGIFHIVGCAHNPNILIYFLYAANDLAITSQNLAKKARFCEVIA